MTAFTTYTAKSMESKLTFDQYITPPAISIECPADETPESLGYSRLIQSSPVRSPSTEDTTPRGFSSLGMKLIICHFLILYLQIIYLYF